MSRPFAEEHDDDFDGIGRERSDPPLPRRNGPAARAPRKPKFQLTPFNDIKFETADEWLVKKLLPRKGVAAIYGASGSVKTFILLDLSLHIALGWPWAGRRVVQAPAIYIAAEGAAGLRKRKIGWELAHDGLPDNVPFHLIEVAPNLGAGTSDLKGLIASIETAGVRPGEIAIDTVAQSMGVGDENNTGMVQFAANITALANHFECLVAAVHHVGLGDEKRLRGHSSFLGALDVSILSERKEGALAATLTVMKLKDEESAQKFTAHLARVVIGKDSDGEDVSTLIVESVEIRRDRGGQGTASKINPPDATSAYRRSRASPWRRRNRQNDPAVCRWPTCQSRVRRGCAAALLCAPRRKRKAPRRSSKTGRSATAGFLQSD